MSSRGWSATASHGLRLDGYWMDIGTPERYLRASWDILEGRVKTRGGADRPGAAGRRRRRPSPTSATVGPRAVLGPGCRVEAGAEVRDSVLLDGCTVGEGATVSGSILAAGRRGRRPGRRLDGAVIGRDERVPAQT